MKQFKKEELEEMLSIVSLEPQTIDVGSEWGPSESTDGWYARLIRVALDLLFPAPTHKHVKRGGEYVLIGFGKMQAEDWVTEHGRDGCMLVDMLEVAVYRCVEDGTLWVRPKEEFNDGRFLDLRPL